MCIGNFRKYKMQHYMEKRRISKAKKIKIIKIIIFVIAGAGLIILLYPSFVNAFVEAKQAGILSEWEAQKEDLSGEETEQAEQVESPEVTPEDTYEGEDQENEVLIGKSDSSAVDSAKSGKGIIDYSKLTAEDFFPLKIRIPKIDLEWIVNEGTDTQTLKEGPGHIPETPLPGDAGRCTISGHRTTYGAPFNKIDTLEDGDLIYLETIEGELFIYAVTELEIVKPKDVYILEGTNKKELLLTSCYPEYSASERIILISELINIYPLELASAKNK